MYPKSLFKVKRLHITLHLGVHKNLLGAIEATTLQSIMNAKLSKQRFWHCHENGLIKTIQTTPHNLDVTVKLTSLY